MSGYLLDTNVVSELTDEYPEPRVIAYLAGIEDKWLSSVVVHEMEFGVQLLPLGRRRNRLRAAHTRFLAVYSNRIIPLEQPEAEWAARFRAVAQRRGRILHLADALIAGTAKANDLTLVTRNVRDFELLDIEFINPWEDALD